MAYVIVFVVGFGLGAWGCFFIVSRIMARMGLEGELAIKRNGEWVGREELVNALNQCEIDAQLDRISGGYASAKKGK